jgi:hypothetical protein
MDIRRGVPESAEENEAMEKSVDYTPNRSGPMLCALGVVCSDGW